MVEIAKKSLRQQQRYFESETRERYTLLALESVILESFRIVPYIKVDDEQVLAIVFSIDYFKDHPDEVYRFESRLNNRLFVKQGSTLGHYGIKVDRE